MMSASLRGSTVLSLVAAVALVAGGCRTGSTGGKAEDKADKGAEAEKDKGDKGGHNFKGRDWCREHGVPESICTRCDASLVAKFKEKKDWCKEHDLPESQCFICHPELQAKFAAAYKAKYGDDPPPIEEEPEEKDSKKESK